MNHMYDILLRQNTQKTPPIKHQQTLEDSKAKIQEATGLRPTNERLLKGIKRLTIPPRAKDLLRNMLTGRIKCGDYWNKIPGLTERAHCSFCKKKANIDILESEHHLWLECPNNGQHLAWGLTRAIWHKTTDRPWPNISLGLIRGVAALSFDEDLSKDSERLRILVSMMVWTIWKSRNQNSINNQDVSQAETVESLKEHIRNLVIKSWNATRFLEENKKRFKRRALRVLRAHRHFASLDPRSDPTFDFS